MGTNQYKSSMNLTQYGFKSYLLFSLIILLFTGCTSIGKIDNSPEVHLPKGNDRYSVIKYAQEHSNGDVLFVLAFSGGGTRAAALSYGVLEELRDTHYQNNKGEEVRLLDEVDRISSVSGGSFTSAYYGLFGDQIFEDYKEVFLYKDVQGDLSGLVFGIFDLIGRMFSTTSRTEVAIEYYDQHIFRGKTFADLQQAGGPFIFINSTDLTSQNQFTFVQPQFDFLCSDLSQFKIARAVAASSAVPILFPPILLERHEDCNFQKPEWLIDAETRSVENDDLRLEKSVSALSYYIDKNNPAYLNLLDGGISDNLGLRSVLNSVALSGGAKSKYENIQKDRTRPKHVVFLVVDASTTTNTDIGKTTELPSISSTLSAVTDIQLHLYNTETNSLAKRELMEWTQTISTEEHPLNAYFIDLNVTGIEDKQDRIFFNAVPTSFTLEKPQADKLIELARGMLRNNSDYQKLLRNLNKH